MHIGHSPAPWIMAPGSKTVRAMPQNYWIATLDSWDGAVDHEANAKLICAAPELLAALEMCVKCYEEIRDAQPTGNLWPDPTHIFHAREAIKKAKGE